MKNTLTFLLQNKYFFIIILIVTGILSIRYFGPDNLYEETVESVLNVITGEKIDLSSEERSKENDETMKILMKHSYLMRH